MFPVSGAFTTFGTRFFSPSLGFALGNYSTFRPSQTVIDSVAAAPGINYWFGWALTIRMSGPVHDAPSRTDNHQSQ
jgi:amino acid permease